MAAGLGRPVLCFTTLPEIEAELAATVNRSRNHEIARHQTFGTRGTKADQQLKEMTKERLRAGLAGERGATPGSDVGGGCGFIDLVK